MDPDGTVTGRRAFLATCGTVAFGSGVAYFAAGGDLSTDSSTPDAERSPATGNASDEQTAHGDVDRTTDEDEEEDAADDTPTEVELTTGVDLDLSTRPVAGDEAARVDVYYWTDYLCPFCRRFETETLPQLTAEYVDAGRVRLVALGYPIIDDDSWTAMVWSRSVWRQVGEDDPAAFWRWHGAVFDEQENDDTDWSDETFADVTERTEGVPLEAVREYRETEDEAVTAAVEAEAAIAKERSFQGTPGFLIYNRETGAETEVAGAQPYANFVDAIEDVAGR